MNAHPRCSLAVWFASAIAGSIAAVQADVGGIGTPASTHEINTLAFTVPAGDERLLLVFASHPDEEVNGEPSLDGVASGRRR
jgi:hypothetical protein